MRIMLVSNNYTPYSGGVVSSLNALIPVLQKNGHDVCLVTLDFLGKEYHAANDPDWVKRVSCPIKFCYKKNYMAVPIGAKREITGIVERFHPDVIHSQHPFLLGDIALAVAKKHAIPIVFTYHTLYEQYLHYVPIPPVIIKPLVTKKVLNYCKKVDHIIAPSRSIKESLLDKKIAARKISVIPSGVQQSFCAHNIAVRMRKHGEPLRMITVGRFVKEKNIPFLLDVVARLDYDTYTFTLIGYGPEQESLMTYAYAQRGLSHANIKFVCKPEKDVLAQYYREADLFLFSSTTDTQGLVLVEAMAAGTPVIALDGPGQRDCVKDGYNGFLVTTQDQMHEKICMIRQNQKLHARLQKGALKTAQEYAPDRLGQKIIACYASVRK